VGVREPLTQKLKLIILGPVSFIFFPCGTSTPTKNKRRLFFTPIDEASKVVLNFTRKRRVQ
jgi:hypothetical protein